MERPNAVAGLIEKRRELSAHLQIATADVKRLTNDIGALDTVIRLFAAEVDGRGIKGKRLPSPFGARKGELQRVVLDTMRAAHGMPVTSFMIAERFCESRGLAPDDRTLTTIRNRVGNAVIKMKAKGLIREGASSGRYKCWPLVERNRAPKRGRQNPFSLSELNHFRPQKRILSPISTLNFRTNFQDDQTRAKPASKIQTTKSSRLS